MSIKIEWLRCFSVVAATGNLSEAAVRLSRTQSALSMSLKQLEEHLGQKLFESDRKNRLTPLGEQVLVLSQQQLRQFDETVAAIEASAKSPTGLLRIVTIPSFTDGVFPHAIKQLLEENPGLHVEIRDTDTQGVIDDLVQGRADFGIASGAVNLNGIQQFALDKDCFGLLCSKQHPLAKQRKTPTINQVLSSGFIRNRLCQLIDLPEFNAQLNEPFDELSANSHVTVHNTLSLVNMIRTTQWVTVLPEQVAAIAPDELAFRKISGLNVQRPINLLLRERSPAYAFAKKLFLIIRDG